MTDTQKWLVLGAIVGIIWLVYLLVPVLTPFLIAALLAYIANPAVERLQKFRIKRFRLSRTLAVIVVFVVMLVLALVLLFILIPLAETQLNSFIRNFPRFINWMQQTVVPNLESALGVEPGTINLDIIRQTVVNNWQDIGNTAGKLLVKLTNSGQVIFAWLAYILLIPVVTFYLLRDWNELLSRIQALIPRKKVELFTGLARDCDNVLSEFLRGQLLVMLAQGVFYSLGLWIAGLEAALMIGMLAGAVSFVPYLGFIVGFGVAVIAAVTQFADWIHVFYVLIVFTLGQLLEGMVLSPWLVGDRIGLHPVAVIFAVMAGGQLFGFFGVLVALPTAAVSVVVLRHMHRQYLESNFYTP